MIVNSTEFKTNLGKYLDLLKNEDIYILRNGKPAAMVIECTYLTDADLLKENAGRYNYKPIYISYEDFIERYEKTDERLEYIDGKVYAMGSPSHEHQRISMILSSILFTFFKESKCQVFAAPYDVHFENTESKACVQPDLLVICDNENIIDGKYYGIPTLVIEILSQSSRAKDSIKKLNLYWENGVSEYIIVDPIKKNLMYWNFENKEIIEQGNISEGETYNSVIFKGLNFRVDELFKR